MRPGIVAEWPRTSLTTLTGRNLPKIRRPRAHEPSIINERTNASRAQPIDAKECRPGAATISRYKFRMNRAAITMKSALLGFAALSLCRTSFYLGLPCIRHLRRPVTGADLHGAPDRVLAPQRAACDMDAVSAGRMGLSVNFRVLQAFDIRQPLRYLRDCSDCFRLDRLPDGICTHWKAPPLHGAHPNRTLAAKSTGRAFPYSPDVCRFAMEIAFHKSRRY